MEFLCNFDVREILGKGTCSEIKRCIDKRTKAAFAVKEVAWHTRREKRRVVNEGEILKCLDHHNIVRLQFMYCGQQSFYLVMEHASGGDLLNDIVNHPSYSEKTGREIIKQTLEAVQYLHDKRIVHRNIRPEKLLLAWKSVADHPYPPIKLTGFGIARRLPADSEIMKCEVEGSPLYLSPEVVTDQCIGTPVDVWACGVILYILLAGYPPFWSTELSHLFKEIANGHVPFPVSEWKSISPQAKELLNKMLITNPEKRITAKQALQEPWICDENISTSHRKNTLDHLHRFNAKRKLKGAVFTVFAMKRLQQCATP